MRVAEKAVWGESGGIIQRSNLFNGIDIFVVSRRLFGPNHLNLAVCDEAAVIISACLPGDRRWAGA